MSAIATLLRRADEAMFDKFKELFLVDEDGQRHQLPAIYGSKEEAVSYVFAKADENLNDIKKFAVTVKLPLLALERENFNYESEDLVVGYKLHAYSLFQEDMNQISEQVIKMFADKTKPYKLKNAAKAETDNNKSFKEIHWEFDLTLSGLGIGDE